VRPLPVSRRGFSVAEQNIKGGGMAGQARRGLAAQVARPAALLRPPELKAHLLNTAPYQPPAPKPKATEPAVAVSIFDGPMMFALCFCWGFVLIIMFALMHG
jgi:hypothetical protein